MKPGGSSRKGGKFERQICKDLSLWLTKGQRSDLLWRTSLSGGRATIQHRKGLVNIAQLGDIGAIDPEGCRLTDRFVVETKHVKSLDLPGAFLKRTGALMRFWRKLLPVAHQHNRHPFIVARQNGMPIILVVTSAGSASLRLNRAKELAVFHDNRSHTDLCFFLFSDLLKSKCPL
jgi:hypothetical protein